MKDQIAALIADQHQTEQSQKFVDYIFLKYLHLTFVSNLCVKHLRIVKCLEKCLIQKCNALVK